MRVPSDSLLRALKALVDVVPSKDPISILSHILIRTTRKEDRTPALAMRAASVRASAEVLVEAEGEDEFEVAVSAHKLYEIAKAMKGQEIEFRVADNRFHIKSSGSGAKRSVSLVFVDAQDFPPFEVLGQVHFSFELPVDYLKEALSRVSFAVAESESFPALTGIYFNFVDGKLDIVASDGRRLALVRRSGNFPTSGSFLVSAEVMESLVDFSDPRVSLSDRMEFLVSDSLVEVRAPGFKYQMGTISEEFPDYLAVIPGPDNFAGILRADASLLKDEIRGVSIISEEKTKILHLELSEEKVVLKASSVVYGSSESELEGVEYQGEPLKIVFNPSHLVEPLSEMDGEVELSFTGALSPALLRMAGDDSYLNVIMPLRLEE